MPGRLAADVEHVCPGALHAQRLLDDRGHVDPIACDETPAVGERIGCCVQHADHRHAFAQEDRASHRRPSLPLSRRGRTPWTSPGFGSRLRA
jgi:hypothetical protein